MNIGREVDYAVRALSYMAGREDNSPTRRSEICVAQDIPPHYLAKILRKAVAGGLVKSGVGPRGGFWLARPASEITLLHVYQCINGQLCLVDCLRDPAACTFFDVCPQAPVWRGAQEMLLKYLAGFRLAELADREGLTAMNLRGR